MSMYPGVRPKALGALGYGKLGIRHTGFEIVLTWVRTWGLTSYDYWVLGPLR